MVRKNENAINICDVWDAVCVGAGITSLAFSVQVLRKHPEAKILVLDKHIVPGGYATSFRRKRDTKAVFDCSLHKLSGTKPEGGNCFRILSDMELLNEIKLIPCPNHFESVLDKHKIFLKNDINCFRITLSNYFPDDKVGISKVCEEILKYGKIAYYQYQMLDGTIDVDINDLRYAHRNLRDITVREALSERVSDQQLRNILCAPAMYVGSFPEDIGYLYFLHVVYATLCLGNSYIKGSAQALSNALAKSIENTGGKIKLKTQVNHIEQVENGLYSVNTNRGTVRTRKIYINACPRYAVKNLFKQEACLMDTQEYLAEIRPALATTTVYVVLDNDPSLYGISKGESMLFSSGLDSSISAREKCNSNSSWTVYESAYWHNSPMELTNYYSLEPNNGYVVCINVLDKQSHWPDRLTQKYKEKKLKAKEALLNRFIESYPAVEGHIVYSEASTPHTYERFTNNSEGSGYGALATPKSRWREFTKIFPYPNIHFLSHWISGSGYEAAFSFSEKMAKQWN